MPTKKRTKTKYPGVYFVVSKAIASSREERIYYIMYRKNDKLIEEKAGRQFQDDMTPARAALIRAQKIEGSKLSNKEKREAERKKSEAKANKWTIARIWKEYKINKPHLKGIVSDENRFKNYIQPTFGDKEPKEIIPLDVDRIRLKFLKKKAPGTVKNILELLRRIINFGVKKNLCTGITFVIEMPKVDNEKTEDLTPAQLSSLFKALGQSHHVTAANMMRLALYTGMRRGELFRLKWRDIDYQRGFISLKDPKGGQEQKIPLNDGARQVLINHPEKNSDYVFPGRNGNKRSDIKKAVNKIKEAAGLPKDFRALHGLRHVYASMLASSGQVDMYTLQKLMTHKSPAMTQRYAHLRDDALKNASDLANNIIEQAIAQRKNKVTHLNPLIKAGNE